MRAGAYFFLLGIPAGLINIAASPRVRHQASVAGVVVLDVALVVVASALLLAPWGRWSQQTQLLVLPVGSLMTVATDRVYGYSAAGAPVDGTVVYAVFATLWVGLTQRRWRALVVAPLATLPVLVADAARNGTANIVPAVGMLVLSIAAAEALAAMRQREGVLVRQLRRLATLTRSLDLTVAHGRLAEHVADELLIGLEAVDVTVDGVLRRRTSAAGRSDRRAAIAGGRLAAVGHFIWRRTASSAAKRIEIVVRRPGIDPMAIRVTLSEEIATSARASLEVLLEEILGQFVVQHREVTDRLRTDPLTRLGNRIAADEALAALHAGDALVLLDIDHFKNVNDTFGHASGDAILQHVAGFLRAQLRSSDVLCRFGGDELLIVLRDTVDAEQAMQAILQRWSAQRPPVTLSAGLAVSRDGESGRATLERADAALYAAKHGGRARLCVDA